jgi:hypothetical protein
MVTFGLEPDYLEDMIEGMIWHVKGPDLFKQPTPGSEMEEIPMKLQSDRWLINLLESLKGIVYIWVVTFAEVKLFSHTLLIDNKGLIINTL